jgi:hypothetical protein
MLDSGLRISITLMWIRMQHFNVDPVRIRIVLLLLIKVMGFCNHWAIQGSILSLQVQASFVSVHGSPVFMRFRIQIQVFTECGLGSRHFLTLVPVCICRH